MLLYLIILSYYFNRVIIGIDETGDFDPNSTAKQFFVAVAVDQNLNKYDRKKTEFLSWESTIPDNNRDQKSGEIKGRNLTLKQLDEFFFEILIKPPRSFFNFIEFNPVVNPPSLIESHKAWNLDQMRNAQKQRQSFGHVKWAKRYEELISWYSKSNYQRIIKIECLQNLYGHTFRQAFFYAQILFSVDNNDHRNFNFQFKIDKDFVRSDLLRNFWDIRFFKFWEIFVKEYPLSLFNKDSKLIDALNKYFVVTEENISAQEPFNDHTIFVDSTLHFEVRLADILGNILHRWRNKGQCEEIGRSIVQIAMLEPNVPIAIKLQMRKHPRHL